MKIFEVEGHAASLLPDGMEFELVWSDEFDGDKIDETKWDYRLCMMGRRHPAWTDQGVKVENSCAVFSIFEENGEVMGYGVLAYTYSQEAGGKVVWLEEIYVCPGYRGRGLGSEFIDFVLEKIPAKRYRLETEPENEAAARLYVRKGFEFFEYINYRMDK